MYCDFSRCPHFQKRRPIKLQPYLFASQIRFYVRFLDKVGKWRNQSVTGRALLFFAEYRKRVCSHPCIFSLKQVIYARAPFGPEYIAKVAMKAMPEAGLETAEWKAHFLLGAAATNIIANGVSAVVVQARAGGWLGIFVHHGNPLRSKTSADPLGQIRIIPTELTLAPGDIAFASSSFC